MYLLYSLLFTLGFVLTAPYYLWRHRGKLGLEAWRERFGFLPESFRQAEAGAIWVHAVSVGETLAVAELIGELARRYPGRKIFLSHVTPTGREAGEKRLQHLAGRFYLPFDWAWSVRRVISAIRPALLLIVETELWPNLVRAADESGCRIALVNARISDRSFPRYLRVRFLMRPVLNHIDRFCVQTPADADRFEALGARPEKVVVTGNLKFDARPAEIGELPVRLKQVLEKTGRAPVWIAASTMPKEEALVIEAWREIRRCHPRALMILAPRHPARFDEVEALFRGSEIPFGRRTALPATQEQIAPQLESAEILLLDTIGELAGMFQLADVVFVGGSLVPTGGHNPLEPAFWAKPVIFGPHMENFRDVADLFLKAGAAIQVASAAELALASLALLDDASRRLQLGGRARQLLDQQSGAVERTLGQIKEWLAAGVRVS